MNKEQLLKAIGTYDEKDLQEVLDLLGIINGRRYNDKKFNDNIVWSNIKGIADNYNNPQYKYVEVWSAMNQLSEMITESINDAAKDGYVWHDTQYQLGNNNGILIHGALLIFKKH